MKKFICLILTLALLCGLLPMTASAAEIIASGTCGYCDVCYGWGECGDCCNNLTWTLTQDGTLTISGIGDMHNDYGEGESFGWYPYKDSVKSLVVEEGVTSIGISAFYCYSNLASVSLPSTLKTIRTQAFTSSGIVNLELPVGLSYLGDVAFAGCEALEYVKLPSGSEYCVGVFSGCTSLKDIEMGAVEVWDGGYDMFSECHSLLDLDFYTQDSIGSHMFAYCSGFTQLQIPEGIVEILSGAFSGNCNLTSVTLPSTLETMGFGMFIDCDNLTEIRFTGDAPASNQNALAQITATAYYPANNASWTEEVMDSFGGEITWISYETEQDKTIGGSWGENLTWTLDEDGILTISGNGEMAHAEDYHDDLGWYFEWKNYNDLITALVIEEGVTTVAEGAFADSPITSASLPNSLRSIGTGAFADSALTSIEIPDSVTYFGMSAFYGCEDMTSVILPAGLEFSGEGVFGYCTSLTSVVMPEMPNYDIDTWSSLSLYALFEGCSALTDIDFVTFPVITEFMFSGCNGLTEVVIPEGVEEIWNYSFNGCENLESVTIPASVTKLQSKIFYGEQKLEKIIFKGSAPAFDGEDDSGAPFESVTAVAYYPAGDVSWTEDVMASFGGDITWVPYAAAVSGDTDGDGIVNDSDVARLLWYTLFPDTYTIVGNADFNGDGTVDSEDVAYLLWHTLFPKDYPLN